MYIKPIGVIHSPFKKKEDFKQSKEKSLNDYEKSEGELEIFSEFEPGLKDIDNFSHLIIIFAFHKSRQRNLFAHPPHDGKKRGVFSTRSPDRPNPLGMTVVKLIKREKNRIKVSGVDMIEGTPILDIKPYTPKDLKEKALFGWLSKKQNNKCLDFDIS
ncbi:MAG: tRNA (N6-threonylcarbamoyladenosine(37)-N6)-methyltransferase TrmO [Candidatus Aminicenantes bacterium]|nr:tRNA (N6-threonylcarbamoyladenosine(37)-N6)-methyltransferase TrmO [Candidatus Aminicenantes bacterium]HHF51452.1 tRNA (N6-threonylcarbamoyladenosine(37)-N6)-methyltransferase TrmO [Candidatus Aminicenantes bacterium]